MQETAVTDPDSPLDRLFRLQELLLEVKKKTQLRDRTPEHLVHVEATYRESVKRRDEAGDRLSRAEDRKRTLDGEVADLSEKLKKYQQQLVTVKTNREYGALLNEIDTVKRDIRMREDEILNLEETLATTRSQVKEQEQGFPEETARYEEQMSGWRDEQKVFAEEIEKARGTAEKIRATIDRRLLSTFDRIAKARAGVAVARVSMVGLQTAACSACNVRLRPQLLSDLRLSKDTILCESCKRILYWDGPE